MKSYDEVKTVATNNTATTTDSIYKWNQTNGQKASSSGNIYGIYDLSGGLYERTVGYVANENENLKSYGSSFTYNGKDLITESTKYAKVYEHDTTKDNNEIKDASGQSVKLDEASVGNYAKNTHVYGDAMYETSTAGLGTTSWYGDRSYYIGLQHPFSFRGGYFVNGSGTGLFLFHRHKGEAYWFHGFRPVVVAR